MFYLKVNCLVVKFQPILIFLSRSSDRRIVATATAFFMPAIYSTTIAMSGCGILQQNERPMARKFVLEVIGRCERRSSRCRIR